VFEQNPDAVKIVFFRDTVQNAGEYQIFSVKGLLKKEEIPAASSPRPFLVATTYPKTYSRQAVGDLIKWLESGDKGLISAKHEVAGVNFEADRNFKALSLSL
jgi:hypothetical protein